MGCGFLGFYHVGVTRCLCERAPHLIRHAHRFFGTSAGALHCAVFLSGTSLGRSGPPPGSARSGRARGSGAWTHTLRGPQQVFPDGRLLRCVLSPRARGARVPGLGAGARRAGGSAARGNPERIPASAPFWRPGLKEAPYPGLTMPGCRGQRDDLPWVHPGGELWPFFPPGIRGAGDTPPPEAFALSPTLPGAACLLGRGQLGGLEGKGLGERCVVARVGWRGGDVGKVSPRPLFSIRDPSWPRVDPWTPPSHPPLPHMRSQLWKLSPGHLNLVLRKPLCPCGCPFGRRGLAGTCGQLA